MNAIISFALTIFRQFLAKTEWSRKPPDNMMASMQLGTAFVLGSKGIRRGTFLERKFSRHNQTKTLMVNAIERCMVKEKDRQRERFVFYAIFAVVYFIALHSCLDSFTHKHTDARAYLRIEWYGVTVCVFVCMYLYAECGLRKRQHQMPDLATV